MELLSTKINKLTEKLESKVNLAKNNLKLYLELDLLYRNRENRENVSKIELIFG